MFQLITTITLKMCCLFILQSSKYCLSDRGVDFIIKKNEEGPYWERLLKDAKKVYISFFFSLLLLLLL